MEAVPPGTQGGVLGEDRRGQGPVAGRPSAGEGPVGGAEDRAEDLGFLVVVQTFQVGVVPVVLGVEGQMQAMGEG